MIFNSYVKTDSYFEFTADNGVKYIIPAADVILVDDESGAIAVKNTASRCTIGLVTKQ